MEARCGCGLWGMGKGSSLLNSKNYVKHFTCFLPGTDFTITWVDSHIPSYTSLPSTYLHNLIHKHITLHTSSYCCKMLSILYKPLSLLHISIALSCVCIVLFCLMLHCLCFLFFCFVAILAHLHLIYSCVDCLLYVICSTMVV